MKNKLLPIIVATLATTLSSQAAILAQWDTTGFAGTETSIASNDVIAGISVTSITLGSELATTAGGGGMNTTSWSTALNATAGNYYGFSVTVNPSYQLNLTTWEFSARSSNTGPGNFAVFYSGDSFASAIDTFSTSGASYGNVIVDLSSLGTLLAGTYEFRVGLLDDTQSDGVGTVLTGGTHRIMNFDSTGASAGPVEISLNGTAIPEPSTALLGGLGMLALVRRRVR